MTRASALNTKQYCAMSDSIQTGSGRAAIMSTWFHAHCSGEPTRAALWAQLTEEERADVSEWHGPADVELPGGIVLRYKDAAHEIPMAVDASFREIRACDGPPHTWPGAWLSGTPDMMWFFDETIFIGDIKKQRWTTLLGPKSLQLIAYGLLAHLCKYPLARRLQRGIWLATEGEWIWGDRLDLDSKEVDEEWAAVAHAANNNTGEYSPGQHCRDCWGRMQCPEHVLPAAMADTRLAALTANGQLTSDKALELLLFCEQVEDMVKLGKAQIKEWIARGGEVRDPTTNKRYLPVISKGRESLNRDLLAQDLGADGLKKYMKRGAPFESWRWLNGSKK